MLQVRKMMDRGRDEGVGLLFGRDEKKKQFRGSDQLPRFGDKARVRWFGHVSKMDSEGR